MRPGRILAGTLGHRRGLLAADQVNLADLADIDPHARYPGDGGTARVAGQPEHVGMKSFHGAELLRRRIDADARVMDLQNLYRHRPILLPWD